MLSACGKPAAECGADVSKQTTISIIKDKIVAVLTAQLSSGDVNSANQIGPSTIRAAVDKLAFSIDDIRTSESDPNSSKKHCNGEVKAVIPVDIFNSANKARQAVGQNTIGQFADLSGVKAEADKYIAEIAYSVQPTDDGKKIYAETAAETPFIKFLASVVSDSLTAAAVQQVQQQVKAEADQQATETASALDAKRKADLNMAQTNNRMAVQVIGAVWQSLQPDTRKQLLPLQRAWIGKVQADCRVEAAAASTDPLEMQTARLSCETRENIQRTEELKRVQEQSPQPNGSF